MKSSSSFVDAAKDKKRQAKDKEAVQAAILKDYLAQNSQAWCSPRILFNRLIRSECFQSGLDVFIVSWDPNFLRHLKLLKYPICITVLFERSFYVIRMWLITPSTIKHLSKIYCCDRKAFLALNEWLYKITRFTIDRDHIYLINQL